MILILKDFIVHFMDEVTETLGPSRLENHYEEIVCFLPYFPGVPGTYIHLPQKDERLMRP